MVVFFVKTYRQDSLNSPWAILEVLKYIISDIYLAGPLLGIELLP
jgi:hypothetical protein